MSPNYFMHHILQDIQYISRKNDTNIYWELRWAQTFIYFFYYFNRLSPNLTKMVLWSAFLYLGKLKLREDKKLGQVSKVHRTWTSAWMISGLRYSFPLCTEMTPCKWQQHGKQSAPPQSWQPPAVPHPFLSQLSEKNSALVHRNPVPQREQPSPIVLPHTQRHKKFQVAPSSGPASWACELGTLRRTPCLVSGSAVAVLKSLIIFEQEALHFHFALGPANQAAGPAHLLQQRAQAAFPRKSGPASHSPCVSKNGTHSPWMVRMEQRQVTLIRGGFLPEQPQWATQELICPPFPISALHSTLPGFWPCCPTHPSLNAQSL